MSNQSSKQTKDAVLTLAVFSAVLVVTPLLELLISGFVLLLSGDLTGPQLVSLGTRHITYPLNSVLLLFGSLGLVGSLGWFFTKERLATT